MGQPLKKSRTQAAKPIDPVEERGAAFAKTLALQATLVPSACPTSGLFKIGDVVTLKSGGLLMTVSIVFGERSVKTIYSRNGHDLHEMQFHPHMLRHATEAEINRALCVDANDLPF